MAKARIASMSISVLLLLASSAVVADIARNKSSSGGVFWATAKDESELVTKADAEEHDEFEGGFSSLDGMLQWAIGHSDPTKLKEAADDVQRLSANELSKRQVEIKEFMEKLKMPSDAELMLIAIADLNNSSISLEDRLRALNELLILVEPIDNANDLNKLGGLVAIIRELNNSEPEIRTASAWILGKASQNNPLVQNQVLELGVLSKLLNMVKSNFTEEAIKALYAVSAVIRNNAHGQELFFAEAGDLMLQDIMSNSSADVRLRRKSVFLVADLAECQPESSTNRAELPFFSNRLFLKSVVDLMASNDLDLQEKSLLAIRSLLQLASTEALVFKEFCGLDEALERMREQLEGLMEEFQRDYARDMEILRREVESIFHRKLEKVPT